MQLSLSLRDYTTQKKDLNNFLGEEEDHFRGQEKRDFFFFFFFFFCFWVPFIFVLSLHGKNNRHENANFSSPWPKFPHRPITHHMQCKHDMSMMWGWWHFGNWKIPFKLATILYNESKHNTLALGLYLYIWGFFERWHFGLCCWNLRLVIIELKFCPQQNECRIRSRFFNILFKLDSLTKLSWVLFLFSSHCG